MIARVIILGFFFLLVGCDRDDNKGSSQQKAAEVAATRRPALSLAEERRKFKTTLVRRPRDEEPLAEPPSALFRIVHYESPAGKLPAYLSVAPEDGKRRPALIWIHGGVCNSVGPMWEPGPPENDQSASAFREAGIVTMYPALRGGNDGPGTEEGFLGEVDDIIAARDYLSQQDSVDPHRIYLGGHSTGGTMALLAAESSDRFRAVFSFGPVGDVEGYGPEYLPFDTSNPREMKLRSPAHWLASITTPTFVFEGEKPVTNIGWLEAMGRMSQNPAIRFMPVPGGNHFSILYPMTHLIAQKILHDDGTVPNFTFTDAELNSAMSK